MRIATLNLWHGLSPAHPLLFETLEPAGRRKLRAEAQLRDLAKLNADIYCLQEVNPVATRAQEMARRLGCDFQFQPDLTGIKLLGFGPPFNLASGLAILSPQPLREVKAVQLSGPVAGFASRLASWQLKESRYAILSELPVSDLGRTLIVNVHLHHGLDSTEALLQEMEKLCAEVELPEAARGELMERLLAGNLRRESEIKKLLQVIAQEEGRFETVLVCGDFNSTPEGEVYRRMVDQGFTDAWRELQTSAPGYTFDATVNTANHVLQERFPLSVKMEDLSFSAKAKERLSQRARAHETRPRRIDYIWFKSRSRQRHVVRAELFGLPDKEGLAPSDHFGVVVEIA